MRALRAGLEGDGDTLAELTTEDVVAWTPSQFVSSRADLIAEAERRDEAFSDVELEVAPLDVGGDYACAEWSVTMTHSGPLEMAGGAVVDPTGARIAVNGVTVAEFRGELICSVRQYWDELAVFDQLGLVSDEDDD
jgi:ketosteroid isomerase-like protein